MKKPHSMIHNVASGWLVPLSHDDGGWKRPNLLSYIHIDLEPYSNNYLRHEAQRNNAWIDAYQADWFLSTADFGPQPFQWTACGDR
jgi:hypothetical protein